MIAQFENVTKIYRGEAGLKSATFCLNQGDVVGLFGLNGSGKTTTLKLLSGLLHPDRGQIRIEGQDPRKARDSISYLGDKASFHQWMTPQHVEDFMAGLYHQFDRERFRTMIHTLTVPNSPIGQMSKGQSQRLRLVATMARKARLYLLDEPLSGIDLVSREMIIKELIATWDQESVILLSTHEIREVETFFDRGIYLKDGQMVGNFRGEDLRAQGSGFTDEFIKINGGSQV
ncbi:ABC transporter ATP-binding protein [Pseudobacteriovorax antillogorgiicola]|uniref:ABC-2 type transport system ATP-binding protein n=1 Tax=Pseudobacteriovorax antillogorgiicola TaxID=1513793 RepID=A0A1Y6CFV0_9BACT|nr:ABC transporter ATP-binding protein [Pseudobacteriovorax antillogorgiicola]TCS47687.1 ABC-2 type transport system ATP-binding protein [Pseudobacteriovorax antillogorgiicola]SMF59530.1 ABC-2 type transport system ATP-binding protein [Pseudobacteriovorax antillogorgiicola]